MSDNEIVAKKVAFIKEQVSEIESLLRCKSRKEVLSDPWLIKGLKYSLELSDFDRFVELVLDFMRKIL
jgi:hypothetical protein